MLFQVGENTLLIRIFKNENWRVFIIPIVFDLKIYESRNLFLADDFYIFNALDRRKIPQTLRYYCTKAELEKGFLKRRIPGKMTDNMEMNPLCGPLFCQRHIH